MAWAYTITASERQAFKRCRRAWDFGSPNRQNYEPIHPFEPFRLDHAIREALAIYYFPGMWEWNRQITLPSVIEGFVLSMQSQRERWSQVCPFSEEDQHRWSEQVRAGEDLLLKYFDWAQSVDAFTPIRVETDFDVRIPDPEHPGQELATPDGIAIQYRGRVQLLVMDKHKRNWIVRHAIVDHPLDMNQMVLDEGATSECWGWENFFLSTRIAGVLYNEILIGSNEPFRRISIVKNRKAIEAFGRQLAAEILEMAHAYPRVYPSPSHAVCPSCPYLRPCVAMMEGGTPDPILESAYRKRAAQEGTGFIGRSTYSQNRGAIPPHLGKKSH